MPSINQNKNKNNNKQKQQLSRISSLGLLFPQSSTQHLSVHRGSSFVNLPPPSRIEQNALPLLCTRVNSDKFVNHMSSSPPPFNTNPSPSQDKQQEQHQHYQKKQKQKRRPSSVSGSINAHAVVRHAPM
uniref:Uncharacterized protein n=1 Tax=Meloidogyne hapla TaxID=6305 RepID=A0A1I8BBX9_MELHA